MEIALEQPDLERQVLHFVIKGNVEIEDLGELEQKLYEAIERMHIVIDFTQAKSICEPAYGILFLFAQEVNDGNIEPSDGGIREVALIKPPEGLWKEGLDEIFFGVCLDLEEALSHRKFD
jgi:hypothetical protein